MLDSTVAQRPYVICGSPGSHFDMLTLTLCMRPASQPSEIYLL